MKMKTKASLAAAFTFLALLGIMLAGLQTLRHASDTDNKSRIYQLLKSTYNTVVQLESYAAAGKMSDAEAKALATQILRTNKYNDSEYIYVADEQLLFVAAPHDPQIHGTSFHELKDGHGNSVGDILLRAVRTNPNGIAEYEWTSKASDGSVKTLLSVAQLSPRWQWAIGTGIRNDEVNARFWHTARWQVVICLLLASFLCGMLWLAARRLLDDLGGEPEQVLALVRAAADGDMTQKEALNTAKPNSVYGSVLRMQLALRTILQEVIQASEALRQEASHAEQRSSQVDQMASLQRGETDMVASSMTEMTSSAHTVSESANSAADATQAADQEGQKVQLIMQDSVTAIQGLAVQIDTASQVISDLGHDVDNIVSVLDVIRGIAEQTNLLALNAAIEAARAGEQGRGFAVVADEVRNLAKRTQESTAEIQQMIERLQVGSQKAVASMEESKMASTETVTGAQQAASALHSIADALGTITDMSHQIASAAKQQTQVSDDITHRISTIAENSRESADLAKQNSQSTQVVIAQANKLEQQIRNFSL